VRLLHRHHGVFTCDFRADSDDDFPSSSECVRKLTEMEESNAPMETVLSRREVMTLLAATGGIWLTEDSLLPKPMFASVADPSCIVRPEQTEGPYFVDEQLNRIDIRSDPATGQVKLGTPLTLIFQVMRISAGACRPLSGALIDIWHCDAMGVYSDVQDPGFNTLGQKFLRGCQLTDAGGATQFLTIYPGWYSIRTVHIHFKIRSTPETKKSFAVISQVYFPDELTDQVHMSLPYSSRGPRRVRNRHDLIFRDGGDRLMVALTPKADGYAATFSIGLWIP